MANSVLDWTHFNLSHGYINTKCKCSKCDHILTTSYKTKDSLDLGHCKIRKSPNIRTNFSNQHLELYYWCRKPTDSKKASFFFSTLQLLFTAAALYTFKVKKGATWNWIYRQIKLNAMMQCAFQRLPCVFFWRTRPTFKGHKIAFEQPKLYSKLCNTTSSSWPSLMDIWGLWKTLSNLARTIEMVAYIW